MTHRNGETENQFRHRALSCIFFHRADELFVKRTRLRMVSSRRRWSSRLKQVSPGNHEDDRERRGPHCDAAVLPDDYACPGCRRILRFRPPDEGEEPGFEDQE